MVWRFVHEPEDIRAANRAHARAQVTQAQGRLLQTRPVAAQIAAAQAAAEQAHARVQAAEAALDFAKLQRSYTRIFAPAPGLISRLAAHPGQLVQPGQTLVEFVPYATFVTANFKETQITHMHSGPPASISIDAYPGVTLHGRVESFSPATGARFALLPPENATGNFVKVVQRVPVRIEILNPPPNLPLRAGLSAEVTVDTRER
jgi:membrane fusion protein (multidrug efflux system)